MVDEKIIEDVQSFIRQLKNEINIQAVYLFGSCVTSLNNEWSDIDVAIVSDSFEGFPPADNERILKKTKKINRMIEPHPFRISDFVDDNPFVHEIRTKGLKIY